MKTIGKSSLSSVLKVILDVVWYLSIAGLALAVVLAAMSVLKRGNVPGHLNIPVLVSIDPGCYSISAPDYGITGAELEEVSADLHFRSPGGQLLLFFAAYIAVALGILMVVIYQLRNILGTLAAGSPFVAANAWRIRFIGWAVIVGEVAQAFIEFMGQIIVKATFEATGVTFGWHFHMSFQTLFWGFVILAVAEVFRLGVELREDQSLTV
jgi:hypothetical protein